MSLEEALIDNTKAMRELTAAMRAGGGGMSPAAAAPAGEKRGPGRPSKASASKVPEFDAVKAVAYKVKADKGGPAAVALIQKHGAENLADLKPEQYAAFIAAAEVVLNENEEAEPAAAEDEL